MLPGPISPKFQLQLAGEPVDVSMNDTESGSGQPAVGDPMKLATGGGGTKTPDSHAEPSSPTKNVVSATSDDAPLYTIITVPKGNE